MTSNDALTYAGTTQPITEWALDYGIYPAVIVERLARGWSSDRAITTPMLVAPSQRLSLDHMPSLPKLKRPNVPRAKVEQPIKGQTYEHEGVVLTLRQWSERTGLATHVIRYRLRSGLPFALAIDPAKRRPGVGKNFAGSKETGGRSTPQDFPEIEFSQ